MWSAVYLWDLSDYSRDRADLKMTFLFPTDTSSRLTTKARVDIAAGFSRFLTVCKYTLEASALGASHSIHFAADKNLQFQEASRIFLPVWGDCETMLQNRFAIYPQGKCSREEVDNSCLDAINISQALHRIFSVTTKTKTFTPQKVSIIY